MSFEFRAIFSLTIFWNFRFGSWQREDIVDHPQKPSQTAAAAAGAAAYQTPAPDESSGWFEQTILYPVKALHYYILLHYLLKLVETKNKSIEQLLNIFCCL